MPHSSLGQERDTRAAADLGIRRPAPAWPRPQPPGTICAKRVLASPELYRKVCQEFYCSDIRRRKDFTSLAVVRMMNTEYGRSNDRHSSGLGSFADDRVQGFAQSHRHQRRDTLAGDEARARAGLPAELDCQEPGDPPHLRDRPGHPGLDAFVLRRSGQGSDPQIRAARLPDHHFEFRREPGSGTAPDGTADFAQCGRPDRGVRPAERPPGLI